MNVSVAPIHLKLFFFSIVSKGDSYFLTQHCKKLFLSHLTILQKLKRKKFNDSAVLAFFECSCYIQNLVIRQKEPVSQICVIPFSNFGNWKTYGPLRIWCLFYIWTRDRPIYRPIFGFYRYISIGQNICLNRCWHNAVIIITKHSVSIDKMLSYSSHMQTTCTRKNNEPSRDSYRC